MLLSTDMSVEAIANSLDSPVLHLSRRFANYGCTPKFSATLNSKTSPPLPGTPTELERVLVLPPLLLLELEDDRTTDVTDL